MDARDYVQCQHRTRGRRVQFGALLSGLRSWLQRCRGRLDPGAFFVMGLAVILAGALALQVLWQHVRANRLHVQITRLKHRNHTLKMKIHRKEIAVSRLERLDRIQQLASAQLGMTPRERVAVLEMEQRHWAQNSRDGKGDEPVQP